MAKMQLEPGWLMRSCHDASIRCMSDHSPTFFERGPGPVQFDRPISAGDARELFDAMDARFKQWVGVGLVEFRASNQTSGKMAHRDDRSGKDPDDDDRIYACADCGRMRSKNEGGTTFTVCDECWDKHFAKKKRTR